jgi:hypothetical protein
LERLTGQELLSKLAKMEIASKSDQARAAGYIRILDDGTQKADLTAFFSALLEAKEQTKAANDKPGEQLENTVNLNGLEYWSALDEDQIETHLCYMQSIPPAAIIPKLANSLSSSIREGVAELLETPKETLLSLVNDEEEPVREAATLSLARILSGRLLPKQGFLTFLSSDELDDAMAKQIFALGSQELQGIIARNSFVSEGCLDYLLASQPADWVETLLMQNLANRRLPKSFADLDEKTIINIISEELPEQTVLESLVVLFLDSSDNKDSLCFFLAQNASAPPCILELLVKKCDSFIKYQVASNTAVPPHVLELLANDPVESIRQIVAKSKFTPAKILDQLSTDTSEAVRASVGLRLLPFEWQNLGNDALLEKLESEQISDEILRLFVADGESRCLLSICKSPYLSEPVQNELAKSSDAYVILELVSNPVTSDAIIELILNHWGDFYEPIKEAIAKRQLPA